MDVVFLISAKSCGMELCPLLLLTEYLLSFRVDICALRCAAAEFLHLWVSNGKIFAFFKQKVMQTKRTGNCSSTECSPSLDSI